MPQCNLAFWSQIFFCFPHRPTPTYHPLSWMKASLVRKSPGEGGLGPHQHPCHPHPLLPLQSANSANIQPIRADTSGQEVMITQKDRPPLALPVSWQEEILAKQLSTQHVSPALRSWQCLQFAQERWL